MRTSNRLFRVRLDTLIEQRGVAHAARFYGRSERTVKGWTEGRTTPSQSIRESVRRRGLTAGAPRAIQVRTGGRFTAEGTIASSGSLNAIASINRQMTRVRRAEMRRARRAGDDRAYEMARASPSRMSRSEEADIALRRERLLERDLTARRQREPRSLVGAEIESLEVEDDDWLLWRLDYEARSG